jgi:hypothetical protein
VDRWLTGCSVSGTSRLHLPYDDILDVLRGFLPAWPVHEDWYLAEHPEVRRFLLENPDETATSHFRKFGYFSGCHPFRNGWCDLRRPIGFERLKAGFDVIVTRAGLYVYIERNRFLVLIKKLLISVPVGEDWYCENYADADEAIRRGQFQSASDHYIRAGYFNGYLAEDPNVDEDWYIARYEHVRSGLACGEAVSAKDHFIRIGYGEGCLPSRRGHRDAC